MLSVFPEVPEMKTVYLPACPEDTSDLLFLLNLFLLPLFLINSIIIHPVPKLETATNSPFLNTLAVDSSTCSIQYR